MKLLKTSIFVILLSLFANSAQSQAWGVRAGANFASTSNSETTTKTGYYAGFYRQFKIIPDLLYLQPELQYSNQGYETKTASTDLNYLQLPVVAKLYLFKIFSLETGPQFGYLVSDNVDGSTNLNELDTAWAFGLGIHLPLHISIDFRYTAGMNDIQDNVSSKNQVFQVGAGLRF